MHNKGADSIPSFLKSNQEYGQVEKLKMAKQAIQAGDSDTAIRILDDCIGEEGKEAQGEYTKEQKDDSGRGTPSFLS